MLLFATYVSWSVAHFFKDLRPLLEMHALFKDKLHICDTDLQAIQWDTIVQRIVDLQQTSRLCIVKDQLTANPNPNPNHNPNPNPNPNPDQAAEKEAKAQQAARQKEADARAMASVQRQGAED